MSIFGSSKQSAAVASLQKQQELPYHEMVMRQMQNVYGSPFGQGLGNIGAGLAGFESAPAVVVDAAKSGLPVCHEHRYSSDGERNPHGMCGKCQKEITSDVEIFNSCGRQV